MNFLKEFDVAIIGAGITGLSTAYALSCHAKLKIALLDQFSIGHRFGGSHGASRIFRSIYAHPGYLKLIKRAAQAEWPQWEREMKRVFLHPNSCCTFGQGNVFEQYLHSVENGGMEIDILDASCARKLFPQFRFPNINAILHDRTGGVLAAQEVIAHLKMSILKRGVQLFEETKILAIDSSEDPIRIVTNRKEIISKRLVVAAGSWIPKLIPSLSPLITPIRQTVGYFKLRGNPAYCQVGCFPNWAFIGEKDLLFYGLPQFGCEGIKAARHATQGTADDPDQHKDEGDPVEIAALEEFLREHLALPLDRLVKSETCFYANTSEEGFILDFLPEDPRIILGSVCSGHDCAPGGIMGGKAFRHGC